MFKMFAVWKIRRKCEQLRRLAHRLAKSDSVMKGFFEDLLGLILYVTHNQWRSHGGPGGTRPPYSAETTRGIRAKPKSFFIGGGGGGGRG